jgi:hypothetical protein
MSKTKFIALPDICGNSYASQITVDLFNSVRKRKRDSKGFYLLKAIQPERNGVLVVKEYLPNTNKGGRPRKEPTKTISFRVPATLAPIIQAQIKAFLSSNYTF